LLTLSTGAINSPKIYSTTSANAANVVIKSSGNILRSTSSIKYKKDVETLQDSYADSILSLRPVWYRSKCVQDSEGWSYWGLIAEEVAEIDPRLVSWKTEEYEDQEIEREIPAQAAVLDDDGNVITEAVEARTVSDTERVAIPLAVPEAEGVQYDRIVPHLINLLQRQAQTISDLTARIEALEA
jgi:hypothetical protein